MLSKWSLQMVQLKVSYNSFKSISLSFKNDIKCNIICWGMYNDQRQNESILYLCPYLIQLGSIVIIPSYQQRYTKWSYTAATNRVIIKMSKNKNYRQHRNQLLVRPRIQKKQITKIYTGTTCNCNWSVSGIFSVYSTISIMFSVHRFSSQYCICLIFHSYEH